MKVPDVVGMKGDKARTALTSLGLSVEWTENVIAAGNWDVDGQDPKAGSTVEPKSTVTLKVSKKPAASASNDKPATTPTTASMPSPLWKAGDGKKQITCEDGSGYFTARFTLPTDNSDPLVKELQEVLTKLDESGWNVLVVSVEDHASYPEVDEGDYFKQLTLTTPSGDIELDFSQDGPGDVLRETGVLAPNTDDHPEKLKRQADDVRVRMYHRNFDTPNVYYLMTKEKLTEVRSAVAGFPSSGTACTA